MADYIYTMESRLSPEQMRTVNTVQNIARSHGMNIYLTGGAIRDILTGFPIRDLDFTVQGNPLELQQEIEKSGGIVDMVDPRLQRDSRHFSGHSGRDRHGALRGLRQARQTAAGDPGHDQRGSAPPRLYLQCDGALVERGSRGLLLDPFNGAADIEARLIRVLHSYAFLEDPSRLIRATRFATRFGWELEERTRARYDSAREGEYIQFMGAAPSDMRSSRLRTRKIRLR